MKAAQMNTAECTTTINNSFPQPDEMTTKTDFLQTEVHIRMTYNKIK